MELCYNVILRREPFVDCDTKNIILLPEGSLGPIGLNVSRPEEQEDMFIFHTLNLIEDINPYVGTCIFRKIGEQDGTMILKELNPHNINESQCESMSQLTSKRMYGTYILIRDDEEPIEISDLIGIKGIDIDYYPTSIVLME